MLRTYRVILLCSLMISAASCQTTSGPQSIAIPSGVNAVLTKQDNVRRNPSAYVGKKVLVQGKVEDLVSENAFILAYGGGWWPREILVVRPSQSDAVLAQKRQVEVIGEVKLFNIATLEREVGRRLDSKLFSQYENQPYIITDNILNR